MQYIWSPHDDDNVVMVVGNEKGLGGAEGHFISLNRIAEFGMNITLTSHAV